MTDWQVLITIASPIFAAGGAYAAVGVHLHYLRRDVDDARREVVDAHARIDKLTETLMNERGLSTGKFEALLSHAHHTRPAKPA